MIIKILEPMRLGPLSQISSTWTKGFEYPDVDRSCTCAVSSTPSQICCHPRTCTWSFPWLLEFAALPTVVDWQTSLAPARLSDCYACEARRVHVCIFLDLPAPYFCGPCQLPPASSSDCPQSKKSLILKTGVDQQVSSPPVQAPLQ